MESSAVKRNNELSRGLGDVYKRQVLTREVFLLEVTNSGYHHLLSQSVDSGLSYEAILKNYNEQIGLEGRTVLKAMIMNRDEGKVQ
ncbi:hypothetical protein RAG23_26545 [Klebsiella quasipneumoniae subsp. similipneumoniae]